MKNRKQAVVIGFSTAVILMAAGGFLYKITEFAQTILKDELQGFGISAIATYLVGMFGLLFLSLWGFFRGYFRDIERPKYRMLEMEEDYERIEQRTGQPPLVEALEKED